MAILPTSAWMFCGGTYQAVSAVIDAERAINLYPEKEPTSAKEQVTLIGTPGLTLFATLAHSPVRALWAGNGKLFAVGGTHVYEPDPSTGGVVTDYGAMAGSTGSGLFPCKFMSNGVQLLVLDSSIGKIFNTNVGGPSMDFVFNGFDIEYLDTFFFALASDATLDLTAPNTIQNSASLNGGSWPALNAAQKTTTIDQVNGLCVVNSNLWVFGQKTTVPFYNTGSAGFPLAIVQGGTIQQGALGVVASLGNGNIGINAAHIIKANNTVYWVGADDRGFGGFWTASGLLPVKISTPGVEAVVQSYGNLQKIRGFAYDEDGHKFVVWNFPNANSGAGATMVYDIVTKQFHERSSGNSGGRWLADNFASVQFNSGTASNFVGDYSSGNIYIMSLSTTSDNSANIVRTRTAPIIAANNEWLCHGSVQMDADIGTANMVLTMSNDGARNFLSNSYTIPKIGTSAASGVNTYVQHQLGRSRQRVYKVTITDNANPIRLIAALADVYQ